VVEAVTIWPGGREPFGDRLRLGKAFHREGFGVMHALPHIFLVPKGRVE
jgi:hypothetical protein